MHRVCNYLCSANKKKKLRLNQFTKQEMKMGWRYYIKNYFQESQKTILDMIKKVSWKFRTLTDINFEEMIFVCY